MYIKDIERRSADFGVYIAENEATVRETARFFGISKSTVHKDVSIRLKTHNPALYSAVSKILKKNKNERHIRGGNATKLKYERKILTEAVK